MKFFEIYIYIFIYIAVILLTDQEEIEVDLPVDKKKSSDNGEHVQRFISGVNDDFNEDGRDLSNFLEVLKVCLTSKCITCSGAVM